MLHVVKVKVQNWMLEKCHQWISVRRHWSKSARKNSWTLLPHSMQRWKELNPTDIKLLLQQKQLYQEVLVLLWCIGTLFIVIRFVFCVTVVLLLSGCPATHFLNVKPFMAFLHRVHYGPAKFPSPTSPPTVLSEMFKNFDMALQLFSFESYFIISSMRNLRISFILTRIAV